jgi:hypothetical protein
MPAKSALALLPYKFVSNAGHPLEARLMGIVGWFCPSLARFEVAQLQSARQASVFSMKTC